MKKFNMKSTDFIKCIEKQPVLLRRFEQLLCIVEDSAGDIQKAAGSGESLFLRKLVLGIPAQASGKNLTRPLMPSAPQTSCVRATSPLSS